MAVLHLQGKEVTDDDGECILVFVVSGYGENKEWARAHFELLSKTMAVTLADDAQTIATPGNATARRIMGEEE